VGHVLDEGGEEGVGAEVGVVGGDLGLGWRDELRGNDAETLVLESREDTTHEAAADGVGLDNEERALRVRRDITEVACSEDIGQHGRGRGGEEGRLGHLWQRGSSEGGFRGTLIFTTLAIAWDQVG